MKRNSRRTSRVIISSLILISLGCNIAALVLPFMTLRKGLMSEPYSLFHSVSMLWSESLYVLAVLVVGFSVLFPFAKLATLAWAVMYPDWGPAKQRWVHRVERFGKWSMLDVFLVSIILLLASKQFFVGAKPQLGLSLFIVAIMLSMIAGEILFQGFSIGKDEDNITAKARGGLFLFLSGISLLAALAFPFLRIEDRFLTNREYSIFSLVPVLWRQEAWLAALLAAIFLVIAPLIAWCVDFTAWYRRIRGHASRRLSLWISLARRWSMLDVFGLALTVFAIESDRLMKTEIHWGALFLGATLVLQVTFSHAFGKALRTDH